ncbi:unnamed protein product, partial [marine sediment metagenome]
LLTDVPDQELEEFRQQISNETVNPMMLKKRLAREIVTQLYSQKEATEAEEKFTKVIQKKEVPKELQEFYLAEDITISRLLVEAGLAASRSAAIRLIQQGAVSIDGKKVTDANTTVTKGSIIKGGKRRYLMST